LAYLKIPNFPSASKSIAHAFAAVAKGPAFGVVGGGETVELVNQARYRSMWIIFPTGGGAMLEFLAGKELPAVKALESNLIFLIIKKIINKKYGYKKSKQTKGVPGAGVNPDMHQPSWFAMHKVLGYILSSRFWQRWS